MSSEWLLLCFPRGWGGMRSADLLVCSDFLIAIPPSRFRVSTLSVGKLVACSDRQVERFQKRHVGNLPPENVRMHGLF